MRLSLPSKCGLQYTMYAQCTPLPKRPTGFTDIMDIIKSKHSGQGLSGSVACPRTLGVRWEYTLDGMPVHGRVFHTLFHT